MFADSIRFRSVPVQAAEVFKIVLSDMVAHRYTPFSRDSCTIVYEVSPHMLLSLCQRVRVTFDCS